MTKEKLETIIKLYDGVLAGLTVGPDKTDTSKTGMDTGWQNTWKHLRWMLQEMPVDDPEKAARWLGFIQGVLWRGGLYTIDEMRNQTRD